LNYVGRKKEISRKNLIFLGWLNLPPKFDIELLSLFRKNKIIIMYKKVLATMSYFLSDNPTRKFFTNRIAAFFKFGPIKLIYSEKKPSRVKKQPAEWKNN
jgi:ssDNA-specific exonuclease RecJ